VGLPCSSQRQQGRIDQSVSDALIFVRDVSAQPGAGVVPISAARARPACVLRTTYLPLDGRVMVLQTIPTGSTKSPVLS
jgi:hypothetical protein